MTILGQSWDFFKRKGLNFEKDSYMVEKQDDFEQFQPKSLQLFQIQNNMFISQFFQIWQHFPKKPSQQKVKNKKTVEMMAKNIHHSLLVLQKHFMAAVGSSAVSSS